MTDEQALDLIRQMSRLADAAEGILRRMTPAEEQDKTYRVDAYVRSENNGGALVYLYGEHPGLKYKVATVYSENYPYLRPFLDPDAGGLWDGETPPSRETAARKRLLQIVPVFEVVLAPSGRRTDDGDMIYKFKAARRQGEPAPAPVSNPAPLPQADVEADRRFAELESASAKLSPQPPKPAQAPGPRISSGGAKASDGPAVPDPLRAVADGQKRQMKFRTTRFVPECVKLLDGIAATQPERVKPYEKDGGYDWSHVQWTCGAKYEAVDDSNWQQVLKDFEAHILAR